MSVDDLLRAARQSVAEVSTDEARALVREGGVFLDVREREEVAAGSISGACFLPRGRLELHIASQVPDRDRAIVVFCAGGTRSLLAASTLRSLGYSHAVSLRGGVAEWKRQGLPVETTLTIEPALANRYQRHLLLEQIGERGQRALMQARVLVVGLGGLGSPAALYLAASGVGHLGLVDDDVVDESNLQRQIIHDTTTLGLKKTASARLAIQRLNPHVDVRCHETRLSADNALDLVRQYDLVVDGCDNFVTRYLVNDACVLEKKPNVFGSVFRFDGQVSVFGANGGPCYRCLFPSPPPAGASPPCAEVGVVGALTGIVGTMQALEVIKLVVGAGEALAGRMLIVDSLAAEYRTVRIQKSQSCPVCGPKRTIHSMVAETVACASSPPHTFR